MGRTTVDYTRKQLKHVGGQKTNVPFYSPVELLKLVGGARIESLKTTMNDALNRGMLSSCRYSEINL